MLVTNDKTINCGPKDKHFHKFVVLVYEIFFLVYEIIAIIFVLKSFVAFVFVVYEIVYPTLYHQGF